MTEADLRTRLREHVEADEPGPSVLPDLVIAGGRRRLRRSRLAAGVAATAAAVVTGAAVLTVVDRDPGAGRAEHRVDPAVQRALDSYDALRMPQVLAERTGDHLGDEVLDGLGAPEFAAYDGNDSRIDRRADWDKASVMTMRYDGDDRRLQVRLTHARSEAEGDIRRLCAQDDRSDYVFSCQTREVGDELATIRLTALVPDPMSPAGYWSVVRRSELRDGRYSATSPLQGTEFDPDDIWFARSVEVVKSDTFVTSVNEYVHASDLASARSLFEATPDQLVDLVLDAHLVIPKPPADPESGCEQWMKPDSGVTCTNP